MFSLQLFKIQSYMQKLVSQSGSYLRSQKGQGTTEYAILVGVLVVIAILAILAFKDNVAKLWDAVANGINQL